MGKGRCHAISFAAVNCRRTPEEAEANGLQSTSYVRRLFKAANITCGFEKP
jgi:hypothetical protein